MNVIRKILNECYSSVLSENEFSKSVELDILEYVDESISEEDFVCKYLNGNPDNDCEFRGWIYMIIAYEKTNGEGVIPYYLELMKKNPIGQEEFDLIDIKFNELLTQK